MDVNGLCVYVVRLTILLCFFRFGVADISELQLTCGDPECKEPIAEGRTVNLYVANKKGVLSFHSNQKVIVYSKGAGASKELWGVKIEGKRGYAPKLLIQELKVLKKELNYNVSTKFPLEKDVLNESPPAVAESNKAKPVVNVPQNVKHNTPTQSWEVEENIDGDDNESEQEEAETDDEQNEHEEDEGEEEEKDKKLTMDDLNQYQVKPEGQQEVIVTTATTPAEINKEQKTPDEPTNQEVASEVIPRNEVHQSTTASSPVTYQPALSSSMSSLQDLISGSTPASASINTLNASPTSKPDNIGELSTTHYTNNEPPAFPSSTSQKMESDRPASSIKLTERFTVIDGTTLPADDDDGLMYGIDGSSTPDSVRVEVHEEKSHVQAVNLPYPSTTVPATHQTKESIIASSLQSKQEFTKSKINDDKKPALPQENATSQPLKKTDKDSDNKPEDNVPENDDEDSGPFNDILGEARNFVSSFFGSQGSEGVPQTYKNELSQNSLDEEKVSDESDLNSNKDVSHSSETKHKTENKASKHEQHENKLVVEAKDMGNELEPNNESKMHMEGKKTLQKDFHSGGKDAMNEASINSDLSSKAAKNKEEKHQTRVETITSPDNSHANNEKPFNQKEKNSETSDQPLRTNPKSDTKDKSSKHVDKVVVDAEVMGSKLEPNDAPKMPTEIKKPLQKELNSDGKDATKEFSANPDQLSKGVKSKDEKHQTEVEKNPVSTYANNEKHLNEKEENSKTSEQSNHKSDTKDISSKHEQHEKKLVVEAKSDTKNIASNHVDKLVVDAEAMGNKLEPNDVSKMVNEEKKLKPNDVSKMVNEEKKPLQKDLHNGDKDAVSEFSTNPDQLSKGAKIKDDKDQTKVEINPSPDNTHGYNERPFKEKEPNSKTSDQTLESNHKSENIVENSNNQNKNHSAIDADQESITSIINNYKKQTMNDQKGVPLNTLVDSSSQVENQIFASAIFEVENSHTAANFDLKKKDIFSTKTNSLNEFSTSASDLVLQSSLNEVNKDIQQHSDMKYSNELSSVSSGFTSANSGSPLETTSIYNKLEVNTEYLKDAEIQDDTLADKTQSNEDVIQNLHNMNPSNPEEIDQLTNDASEPEFPENTFETVTNSDHINEKSVPQEYENIQNDKISDDGKDNYSYDIADYISLLRNYLQVIIDVLPEPLHSSLLDLEKQGVSPRVTVFLIIASSSSVILIVCVCLLKKKTKERGLLVKLSAVEQKLFTTTTERNVQMEELETAKEQILSFQQNISEQQEILKPLQKELDKIKSENSQMSITIKQQQQQLDDLKYSSKELHQTSQKVDEENIMLHQKIEESENMSKELEEQLQNVRLELKVAEEENEKLEKSEEELKNCIAQLENTCSQLLQEAEVWNDRVKELTTQIENDKKKYEELEEASKTKDVEIKGLQETLKESQVIQEMKEGQSPEEVDKKIQQLLDISVVRQKLQVSQTEVNLFKEKMDSERENAQKLEIQLLDTTSELDKLKTNYNLALQDKTEAQTKLDVLSNYFKEKEMQLQKELGVQEAMRQQKEDDATSASRRIALIEQENSSYKYQLASVKQELEETERNLRNQISAQEKRAHESWLAARAAERKLEDAKQEMTQLRQRLTLLEREQEAWAKARPDGIVRPVPKRFPGPNGEVPFPPGQMIPQEMAGDGIDSTASLSADMLDSAKGGRSSLPPTMLPPDRPLPPPPLHPMDHRLPPIPPFLPHLDARIPPPPFGMEPWRLPPPGMLLNSGPPSYHSFDRRMSPPDYERGRMSTPPRIRQSTPPFDRDVDRHSSSPREQQSRDSRSSSPPHPLPRFHDIPPPRPFGYSFPPPPLAGGRLPPFPTRRREPFPPAPPEYRPDSRGGDMAPPRGSQASTPPVDARTNNTTMNV